MVGAGGSSQWELGVPIIGAGCPYGGSWGSPRWELCPPPAELHSPQQIHGSAPPSTAQLHPSTCWALGYLEPLSTDKRTS